MGQSIPQSRDPIAALYRAVGSLDTRLRQLAGKRASVQVVGTNPTSDGDGAIWIDNTDHTLHYVVNGLEYKLTGTLV